MKVKNMISAKGNTIANQFIITSGTTLVFQSYDSIICRIAKGKTSLDKKYWDYSYTTSKYRNLFLGENKKQTQRKIDTGEYKLVNLNRGK